MKRKEHNKYIISADIGGSHITVAVIDLENKAIIDATRVRVGVDCDGSADEILGTWVEALTTSINLFSHAVYGLSMAMPGPFDYKNGISLITGLHKYEAIYAVNIKEHLSVALGIPAAHILFRNDAEAFLHGEVVAGAGLNFKKVIGITLGTGLGSAKSSGGVTVDVNRGSTPFFDSIADDYLSTRWFIRHYFELTGNRVANVKELAQIAGNNAKARLVFDDFAANMALFLKDFIAAEQPDVVVIGGNITKASNLFLPLLNAQLAGFLGKAVIRIAELGEDSSLMGAAASFEGRQ